MQSQDQCLNDNYYDFLFVLECKLPDQNLMSLIIFTPHNGCEIFNAKTKPTKNDPSLQSASHRQTKMRLPSTVYFTLE